MNRPLKIFAAILGGIILILLVTNPSKKDFDDFLGITDPTNLSVISFRMKNNFLFSYYDYTALISRDEYGTWKSETGSYVGILGRFYLLEGKDYWRHKK